MKKLNLSLRILTLFVLALSLNACFVKTSIPTTEVRLEPIRQLSEDEYFFMRDFVYHEFFNNYVKKNSLELADEKQKIEKELFERYKLEKIFDSDSYKIVKDKYAIGSRFIEAGRWSRFERNFVRLKEKDYENILSRKPFFHYSISNDEKYILICQDKDRLKIFDTDEDLKELREWEDIKCDYAFLSFDNNYLIVSYGSKVRIYDFKSKELIYNNPSVDGVCGTNNIVICMYIDNGDFSKEYIAFTNELPQRFLVKEVAKGFDGFYEIKKDKRSITIHDLNLKDNEVQIFFEYHDISIHNYKKRTSYYYLAKLVPIEKGKEDKNEQQKQP